MKCGTRQFDANARGIPAVVISTANSVSTALGAVGMCAHEFLRAVAGAGFALQLVTFDADQRWLTRLRRKMLAPQWYTNIIPPYALAEAVAVVRQTGARFVFLHMVDTAPLAGPLRTELGPDIRIAVLSHGVASADYLHKLRFRKEVAPFVKMRVRRNELARQLCEEAEQRRYIDHVFCLSPVEAEFERWLGAKGVTWLPRTVFTKPLDWKPQAGRIGYVGSVEHEPNVEGLLRFAAALGPIAPKNLRLRIVGGPEEAGRTFAERFPLIDYLGPLTDPELEKEAATWNCVVNPMFCYPRGCSTKLAVTLGWRIPVLTTPAGCRGYTWRTGKLPLSDTPEGLARLAAGMLDAETATAARREIQEIANSCPTIEEVSEMVRGALLGGVAGSAGA